MKLIIYTTLLFILLTLALNTLLWSESNEIVILDVGQGDSILIYNKLGNLFIIDGGPSPELVGMTLLSFPSFDCYVESILLTHPHFDHLFGLNRVLELCSVNYTYYNEFPNFESLTFSKFENLSKRNSNVKNLTRGDQIKFGNITFYVLWPTEEFLSLASKDDVNEVSISLLLDYKDFEMLFTGDINSETQSKLNLKDYYEIIDNGVDVYKVPHHGSSHSFDEKFLKELNPKLAVVSVGEKNSYGHPSPLFTNFFESHNIPFYRTDVHGSVRIKLE